MMRLASKIAAWFRRDPPAKPNWKARGMRLYNRDEAGAVRYARMHDILSKGPGND